MVESLANDYALRMVNIEKYFGLVRALHNINLEVGRNEIVGLIGDNGAGKSTMVKILTGVFVPTQRRTLHCRAQSRSANVQRQERPRIRHRNGLSGQIARRETGALAQLLHRAADHQPLRLHQREEGKRDRQRNHDQHHWLSRQRDHGRLESEQALRRRASGRRHRPGDALRGRTDHPRRADGRALAQRSRARC